jgi:[ribosomal protein S5]-alanine N-acetyltransferase
LENSRSTLPHKSVKETKVWVSKMVDSREMNGLTDFVILLRDDTPDSTSTSRLTTTSTAINPVKTREPDTGPVIGKIGIYTPLGTSKSGEIGFLLNRSYHRRGLVSEALSAVLGYLFEQKGVQTITTDVDPRNGASIGILEKHGFVLTGTAPRTLEIGGEWVDSEYRALTKGSWESKRRTGL